MLNKPCPFCDIISKADNNRILMQNEHGFVIRDGFPVTDGHTLIIPKRHIGSFFDCSEDEQHAMLTLLEFSKNELDKSLNPQGYNIGINDGAAAGQTVPHCHMHLIPRYKGDMDDPKGGVRGVIPEKQKY